MAKKLCYARSTRRSWPLKKDLEQKTPTWQREVDLKLIKSVWGAHLRSPDEDEHSEECVGEPPRACLCCQ